MAEAVRTPDAEHAADRAPSTPRPPVDRTAWLRGRRLTQVVLALIGLQLLVRGWVAATGGFWQDDLLVAGRSALVPIFSSEFLLYDHDGHFMPAGFLLTGLLTQMAPLEWWPMVVAMVLMQALASLAVWRVLRLLLGDRPFLLVPLMLYLFSPVTLPAFSWWMAAVNALPFQAALAWVAGDLVLLMRTGRRRYALTGTIVFAIAIAFFEKAVILPFVVFGVAVLLRREAGDRTPLVSAARRARLLWAGLLVVLAAWTATFLSVVGSPAIGPDGAGTVPQAVALIRNGLFRGLLPSLIGGPLTWAEEGHWADPPTSVVVAGCLALAAAVVWTSRWRRGAGVIWWMVAGYVGANVAAMVAGRLTVVTADILSLNLRYFADTAVVLALAIAFLARAPHRADFRRREFLTASGRRFVAVAAAALFLAGCAVSTVNYQREWAESSTLPYLDSARRSLAASEVPLLDQSVPEGVVWLLAHPYNLASHVFAPWDEGARVGTSTPRLQLLDEDGELVDAQLDPRRSIGPGPLENCGHGIRSGSATSMPLDGPLVALPWTVQLNYLAGADGFVEVALDGEWVRVPVLEGPNTVYVTVIGGGADLRVRSVTDGLAVCLDSGRVGFVEPAG